VTVTLLALVVVATSGGRARAADLGPVGVKPRVGTNNTLFFGYLAHAKCPAGTTDSYWTVDGPDLPHDTAFLGQGNASGTGEQQFRGASIANVRTAYPDSFRRSGTYFVRFSCVPPDGKVRDSYQVPLLYRVAGRGSWQAQGAQQVPDYVLDPSVASPAPTSPSRPTAAPGGGPAPPASGPSATTSRSPGAVPSGPASAGQATGSATSAQGSGGGSGSSGGWWLGLLLLPALGVAAWALRRRGGR
jgi:hypothetical protein